ncbi:hypothetical protein CASFOL_003216 [Castilleja foliolosa]|uniref:C2H2-type domain-containing protein n=1 Tax=Castilleja foliolosa TaxID=1961234 RepID=A0ABD3EGI4_9LAMI
MKSEEGNDSLDTSIRQAVVKDRNLLFTTTPDNPFQWLQAFNVNDHPDLSSWPLLTPVKAQMLKCNKCSQEFCSSINYRRHSRVHSKSLNGNKEFKKHRDLLAAFWDKISLEQANEIISFDVVMLKEIRGSVLIRTLASSLKKTRIWTLPRIHVMAGNTLLDIIQANHSRLPISSRELFSILDEASERTFFCGGTAESVLKHVFDCETDKNCLELNNIIACASFVFEQQLVKVWNANKEAEALRFQKLLVEEEEAAKERQALLLEKNKQKKLRKKQKVKEQFERSSENIDVNVDAVDGPISADASGPSYPYDSNSNPPDMPTNLDSSLGSTQSESKQSNEEDSKQGGGSRRRQRNKKRQKKLRKEQEVKEQFEGSSENIDVNVDAVDGPVSAEASGPSSPYYSNSNPPDMPINLDSSLESTQPESKKPNEEDSIQGGDSQTTKLNMVCPPKGNRHLAANSWQAPKSQRGGRFGLNPQPLKSDPIHKPSLSKDQSLQNRNKIWAKKLKTDTNEENPKPSSPQGKASHQIEENNKVIIGSITVNLKSSGAQQKEATDISSNEHAVILKKSASEKLAKANNRLGSKHWTPVRHDETKSALPLDRGSENIEGSGAISGKVPDQTVSSVERYEQSQSVDGLVNQEKPYCVLPNENGQQGHSPFSRSAKEFLAQSTTLLPLGILTKLTLDGWKEAISSDHVKLVLSEPKPPGSSDVQQESSTIPNASDPLENQMGRHIQVKISKKPGKGVKIKFIPKQK